MMPIRPENKVRYPKDWKQISERIRFKRADNRCECTGECGDEHHLESGNIIYGKKPYPRCTARNYEEHPITGSKVILTVAHLNHEIENCDDDNLKAMCQRCHNKMDAPMRRKGIKSRAFAASASADLFTESKGGS
jgi:hypothetical protein